MSSIRRCEAGTFLKMCMPLRSAADRTNGSGLLSCSSTGPSALAPYFSKPRLAIPPWSSRPPGAGMAVRGMPSDAIGPQERAYRTSSMHPFPIVARGTDDRFLISHRTEQEIEEELGARRRAAIGRLKGETAKPSRPRRLTAFNPPPTSSLD